MLQMKVHICCKLYQSPKPRKPYLIPGGDNRKTIKVIKVFLVNCAPFAGIVERIGTTAVF